MNVNKKKIFIFTSFEHLGVLSTFFNNFFNILIKNFDQVIIINTENLRIFTKKIYSYKNKAILKKFDKKISFFNPINYNDLNKNIDFKNAVVVRDTPRTFSYYRLFYFFARKKINQVMISNSGHVQGSIYYFWGYNFNFIFFYLKRELPKKIAVILTSFGIFSKIDIRFTSFKKLHSNFYHNKKKFFSKPSLYKEMILVKGKQFDKSKKVKKTNEYITLIDFDPDYYHTAETIGKYDKKKLSTHYTNVIKLLKKLEILYKKKIIICIHPAYNIKKISKIYKDFNVVKFRTKEFIEKSFIVLFFDSSSIADAIALKKRIIALRTDLMFDKKHASDSYTDVISFKKVNLSKNVKINKKRFLFELDKKTKLYNKFLNLYSSANLKNEGNKDIIKIINERFFRN